MSMREYALNDYGLVLDEETINNIASQIFKDYTEDTKTCWGCELYEVGLCELISDFIGEAQQLADDGEPIIFSKYNKEYTCNTIFYIPTLRYPTLFKKAYDNIEEIIEEFKAKLGKYLSENFDYRNHICYITGTYCG